MSSISNHLECKENNIPFLRIKKIGVIFPRKKYIYIYEIFCVYKYKEPLKQL